jgi:uncharacterized protein
MATKERLDWKTGFLALASTLLLMVDYYFTLLPDKHIQRFLLFFIIPAALIALIWRQSPIGFGLRLGDWRWGVLAAALMALASAPLLWWFGSMDPQVAGYYSNPLGWQAISEIAIEMFAWEFFLRGWLLFGYGRRFGVNAIWMQMVPFALYHIGKPGAEALSTIFTGVLFGWIAWRSRSVIYPILIHCFISIFILMVTNGMLG